MKSKLLLSVCISILLAAIVPLHDRGLDFNCVWLGSHNLLLGQSPYITACYVYPVWVAVMALPLALLPVGPAYHVYLTVAFTAIFLALLSFRRWRLALLLGVPLVIMTWLWGNIDWLVLCGFVLPFPIALPFLLAKPQLGFVLAALLTVQALRQRRRLAVVGSVSAIGAGFVASLLLGLAWGGVTGHAAYVGLNLAEALFPWCVPIGLLLVIASFRRGDRLLALLAAVLLSPYVGGTAPLLIQALLADAPILSRSPRSAARPPRRSEA